LCALYGHATPQFNPARILPADFSNWLDRIRHARWDYWRNAYGKPCVVDATHLSDGSCNGSDDRAGNVIDAQATNEFLVFGTSATASLLAGTVMHYFGWSRLMWIPIPILILVCVALVAIRKDELLHRGRALVQG
jgi:hypothetical protein